MDKPTVVLEGEEMSGWMMVGEEYALATKISKTEALGPWNLVKAKSSPDWALWDKAIQEELSVLKATGTWELVDTPKGANSVG